MPETVKCPFCHEVVGIAIQAAEMWFDDDGPMAVTRLHCAGCRKPFYVVVQPDGDTVSVSVERD